MAIINQKNTSKLGLTANGLAANKFGYFAGTTTDKLHNQYSVHTDPQVKLVDFNGSSKVRKESTLDELDPKAPRNPRATQYKSKSGRKYNDLGPTEGRY